MPVMKSHTPIQLLDSISPQLHLQHHLDHHDITKLPHHLVTTTAIFFVVDILGRVGGIVDRVSNLMDSMVRLCLSMCCSFSKMWSRFHILIHLF